MPIVVSGKRVYGPPPVDTFVLGVTEPSASNTGPRVAEWQMSNYAGDIVNVAPGAVVDRLIITGRVDMNANLATIRDSKIRVGSPAGGSNDTTVNTRQSNLLTRTGKFQTVEFCEVDPSYFSHDIYGPQGGEFLITRSHIHGVVDGLVAHGSSTVHKAWRIEGSLIEDLRTYAPDPRQSDNITHNDGIQSEGNADAEIIGCAIHGGRTSCVLVTNNVPGGYGYMRILDNWMYGHATLGSTINIPAANVGGLEVKRNRIHRTSRMPAVLVSSTNRVAAYFGCTGTTGNTSDWVGGPDGNVYMDDLTAFPISNG